MRKLEKVTTPKPLKWFGEREDILRYDLEVQRGKAWDVKQKSLLIHSFMVGLPVPQIYSINRGDGNYWILDGQQRLRAISDFMNDRFKLVDVADVEDEVVEGKVFSELSEELQEELKKIQLVVFHYKNVSDEDIEEMFRRLNNGKALAPIEKTRASAGYLLEEFAEMERHGMWDHVSMTEAAKSKHKDMEVLIQTMMVLEGMDKYKNIGSKEQAKAVKSWRSNKRVFNELKDKMEKRMDLAEEVFKELSKTEQKTMLKKSHLPVLVSKMDGDVVPKGTWVSNLKELAKGYKDSEFAEVSKEGSTKKETVMKKLQYV